MIKHIVVVILILTITSGHAGAGTETMSTKSIPVAESKEKTSVRKPKPLSLQQEKDIFTTTLSKLRKIKRELKTKPENNARLESSKIDSYIKSLQNFNKNRNNMPDYLRLEVMAESQDIVNKLQDYIANRPTKGINKNFSTTSNKMSKRLDFLIEKNDKAVSRLNDKTTIKILNEFNNSITVSYIASGKVLDKDGPPPRREDGRRDFTSSTESVKSIFNWTIWARKGETRISEYFHLNHEQLEANKIREIRLRIKHEE